MEQIFKERIFAAENTDLESTPCLKALQGTEKTHRSSRYDGF